MSVHRTDLSGLPWTVRVDPLFEAGAGVPPELSRKLRDGFPGHVPGVVHTDLLAAGLIEDPYAGDHEERLRWIGDQTWIYSTELTLEAGASELTSDHCAMVCHGLDTIADVAVNWEIVLRTTNMHRRWIVDLTGRLHEGTNQFTFAFLPAPAYAYEQEKILGPRPRVSEVPYNAIRKMACNFGWDWGPYLATAGIWKPLELRSWNFAHIAEAQLIPDLRIEPDGSTTGLLEVRLAIPGDLRFTSLTIRVEGPGVRFEEGMVAESETRVMLTIPDVQAWWPHGMGDQPMYEARIKLHNDVAVLDEVEDRVGFRHVELDTTPDPGGQGARFALAINDEPIFVRGADWIPDDCFPSRVDDERYRGRIAQAVDANIDFLRVWGGGIFEQDGFYRACDEAGVLVWQDMLLACAAYSEGEPLRSEIEAEVRDNVSRLSGHPCLVLWCGNNENIWGQADWNWRADLDGASWGAGYYYDLFPALLAELDPSRPYWPGSPFSGHVHIHPENPAYGCTHIWDVWNERDYSHYTAWSPRFVSELGYQGPATWATWQHVLDPQDQAAASAVMLHHQKATDGSSKLERGAAPHLPTAPADVAGFDDWLWTMQLQQARAVRFGVERWRAMRGYCMGSVVWQLNDCWPVTSWAMLDSGRDVAGEPVARRKPVWYAVRSSYADHLLTVQPAPDGGWRVVAINDGGQPWEDQVRVCLRGLDGRVREATEATVAVPTRARQTITIDFPMPRMSTDAALVAEAAQAERCVRPLAEDVELLLPPARFSSRVEADRDHVSVAVTAGDFLRSLALFPDRISENAWADSCLVDLFPGETHVFGINGLSEISRESADRLIQRPALRCANDLFHGH